MVVTVTLDPAVDKTIFVRSIALGAVNRVDRSQLDPAGKGINVSRVVHRLEWPTIALGFLAGDMGDMVERALITEGVQSHFLRIPGETRLNVTIIDEKMTVGTSFYDRGPEVSRTHMAGLEKLLARWLCTSPVLVLAGSLPPGLADDTYATLIQMAGSANVKTILDTHGEALRRGIEAGPYLIKPNVSEAEGLLGRALPDLAAVIAAAKELTARGVETVVISMGAEGAVCARGNEAWRAVPPKVQQKSNVGSGDSMVAGLAIALAQNLDIVQGLRLGTSSGAATAMVQGTALGSLREVDALLPKVRVEQLAN